MDKLTPTVFSNLKTNRVRFTEVDDTLLLQEVLALNPYLDASKWKLIQANMCQAIGKNISCRGLKEHVQYIIKKFEKRDRQNRGMSGVEEPYNELDHLLQEVLELINTIVAKKKNIKFEKISFEIGKAARDKAAKTLVAYKNQPCSGWPEVNEEVLSKHNYNLTPTREGNEGITELDFGSDFEYRPTVTEPYPTEPNVRTTNSPSVRAERTTEQESQANIQGPTRKRKRRAASTFQKQTTLQYLEEKNKAKQSIRLKELQLEEQKLSLEREKLEFEKEKFNYEKEEKARVAKLEENKIQLEIAERNAMIQLMKNQQSVLLALLQKI